MAFMASYLQLSKYVIKIVKMIPASIYLFKVNNGNTRKMCEICSKLTITTQERPYWCRSVVFIGNFEQISDIILVFPFLTLNKLMPTEIWRFELNNLAPGVC